MGKRESVINILIRIIDVAEEMAIFNKTLVKDSKKRKSFNKFLKMCENAKEYLPTIKHDEVLFSIYNNIVHGKEALYTMCPSLIMHKATRHFDTEKGFKEFIKLENQGKKEEIKQQEEFRKKQELLAKAKKEGKELQFVYKDGKMQQVIVDKGEN